MAKTVLIVDSDYAEIVLLCKVLPQQPDLRVVILRDGAEAIRFIEQMAHTPCVVLLDFHLPGSNGLEVLRAIRRSPAIGKAP